MMTSQGWVIRYDDVKLMTSLWRHTAYGMFEDRRMTIKSARWYFLNISIKKYQRGKSNRAGQWCLWSDAFVSVSAKPCYKQYFCESLLAGNLSWIFNFFSHFLKLFCNFFIMCFFWFLFVDLLLFRYWKHLPIHVASEMIKHLSRFSLNSFFCLALSRCMILCLR